MAAGSSSTAEGHGPLETLRACDQDALIYMRKVDSSLISYIAYILG